mgnify:CR=1 FL=1
MGRGALAGSPLLTAPIGIEMSSKNGLFPCGVNLLTAPIGIEILLSPSCLPPVCFLLTAPIGIEIRRRPGKRAMGLRAFNRTDWN